MVQANGNLHHNSSNEPLGNNLEKAGKKFVLDTEQAIRKAFEQDVERGMALLFEYYYPALCSHAVRFVLLKVVAEDIVSDIFYEFHIQQRHQYITSSFRAFLFTAVRHRAYDHIRTEMQRMTRLEDASSLFVPTHQLPDSITEFEELYQDFQKAIHSLPLKRQQIYLKFRLEGKKQQDIADELDLSVRTVEAHLYQATRQIRDMLKDKWLVLLPFLYL